MPRPNKKYVEKQVVYWNKHKIIWFLTSRAELAEWLENITLSCTDTENHMLNDVKWCLGLYLSNLLKEKTHQRVFCQFCRLLAKIPNRQLLWKIKNNLKHPTRTFNVHICFCIMNKHLMTKWKLYLLLKVNLPNLWC